MVNAVYVLLAVLAIFVPAFVLTPLIRSWQRARGARFVVCPRDGQPASVEMDALEVAFQEVFHIPSQSLRICSRWPANRGCGQECLVQISPRAGRA